ncbi:putative lipopolysaccharide biosynthesis protein [unidentified eubacterium SCB49]|nr:putative lipopolysaccharide biosynthesis protein [unidentified eubacterium SCB49]
MNGLHKKLQKGLLWSVVQVVVKRVFDLFVKLILLNILFPEDFGLIGIAAAITAIVYVVAEFGLKDALIQRKKQVLKDLHYQSIFWWSLLWALFIFAFVYFVITPLAVVFYNEPLLYKIIPILTLPVITQALTLVYRVKMLRALNFKVLAIFNSIASIIAGIIAIVVALKGWGFWSLIFYILIPYFITLPLFLLLIPWRPKFVFNYAFFKQIVTFGIYTFGTALVITISLNIDYLLIGRLISIELLGVYNVSFMLTLLVFKQVTSMIDRVLFPFYSKIQGSIPLIKNYYLTSIKYYTILLAPVMLSFIVLSTPIVKFFIGIKWIASVTSLRILAVAVLINLLTHGCTIVFRSIGKPKLELQILIAVLFFVTVPGIYVGSAHGINGVALAMLLSSVVNALICLYFLHRELKIRLLDILIELKAPITGFFVALFVVLPVYLLFSFNVTLLLALIIVVYGVVLHYFYKKEIKQFINKTLMSKNELE